MQMPLPPARAPLLFALLTAPKDNIVLIGAIGGSAWPSRVFTLCLFVGQVARTTTLKLGTACPLSLPLPPSPLSLSLRVKQTCK